MSFREVYEARQHLPDYINRNVIRDLILKDTGIPKISIAIIDVDTEACRGIYLSARNEEHPLVRQHGHHVIGVARGLNRCWRRFISIKEMMHMFADPEKATDQGHQFEALLDEFANQSSPSPPSPQMKSEQECLWMALAIICREEKRLAYKKLKEDQAISDYQIALELKIPQFQIRNLFHSRFEATIAKILEDKK